MDVHHIGAEGDIVFSVHLSLFMAGIKPQRRRSPSTNVDMFRVDRHGRMVEHWDVLQIEGVALRRRRRRFSELCGLQQVILDAADHLVRDAQPLA